MQTSFVQNLHAQSAIAELPCYDNSLDLEVEGGALGKIFDSDPRLPGIIVRQGSEVRGAISRGQYLRLVSRYLGQEVYHPRPIRLMLEAIEAAEKPLILDDRTPVRDAVQMALLRPRELVYEPVIMEARGSGGGALRLLDFQDLLLADSRISGLRNDQMRQILGTVQEGLFLVGRDRIIAAEHSLSIESIFCLRSVAGQRFEDLLAGPLGPELASLGKGYLETLFNPNVIERLVADINPLAQVEAKFFLPDMAEGSPQPVRKHLTFRFLRGFDGERIDRILVRVEDISRQVELEKELASQEAKTRKKVDLLLDIVRCGFEPLEDFLAELDPMLAGVAAWPERGDPPSPTKEQVVVALRRAHGLKGEAGLLGLEQFQGLLHRLEENLLEGCGGEPKPRRAGFESPALRELRALVEDAREILRQLGKLGRTEQRKTGSRGPAEMEGSVSAANAEAGAARRGDLLIDIAKLVEELAERVGKSARFISHNAQAEIPRRYRTLTRRLLIQLVRNALVHGLESPALRARRGKPGVGTLQFAVRDHSDRGQLELVFQDDGGGLDLQRLRQRASAMGLADVSDADLPQLIFRTGFSTAESTTLDAGRGLGLDLVREEIEASGGVIRCHSRKGAFCAFQIVLPRDDLQS